MVKDGQRAPRAIQPAPGSVVRPGAAGAYGGLGAATARLRVRHDRRTNPRTARTKRARPQLVVVAPGAGGGTHTVVIVLPGGRERDRLRSPATGLANLRMIPVGWAANRGAKARVDGTGVAVWRLRYRYRGWNEPARDPVRDCEWALAEARRRHPDATVLLVGHSMGGRTALHAAGGDGVAGVLALAPWIEPEDPVAPIAGRALVIAHGNRDRITDPAASRRYAQRATGVASSVRLVTIIGEGHAMLLRWRAWHALVRDFVTGVGVERRP